MRILADIRETVTDAVTVWGSPLIRALTTALTRHVPDFTD
jgi:hypothetical protein